jgi:branched-chain amino acid transport system substrate-binding protein
MVLVVAAASIAIGITSGSSSATTAAKTPTGAPIIIGDISDPTSTAVLSQVPQTIDAAVNYVNNGLGGIKGRPLQVVHCNSKFDPAAATACATQLAQAGALADVGASLILGTCCLNPLVQGGVALMEIPINAPEAQSLAAVMWGGGPITEPYVTGQWLLQKHAKAIVALLVDTPSTHAQSDAISQSLGGKAQYTPIFYPIGSADLTPQLNQALSAHPDWITIRGTASDYNKFIPALKAAGFPLDHVLLSSSANDSNVLNSIGAGGAGVYIFTGTFDSFSNTANKEIAGYEAIMKNAGLNAVNSYNQWAFANVMMVFRGLLKAKSMTGKGLLNYYNTAGRVPIYMSSNRTIPKSQTNPTYPGIRYAYQGIAQWDGSALKITDPKLKAFPGTRLTPKK